MRVVLHATAGPNAGHAVPFDRHDTFVVGRSARANVRLPHKDPFLSRFHFLVEVNPPLCRVVDLGSRNGITVNDKKVERADLANGDVLKAGHTVFRVAITPPEGGGPTRATRPSRAPGNTVSQPTAPQPDWQPAVGGYRVVREVGRGGMGVVYEAVREADGSTVALKAVRPALAPTARQVDRFRREADILRQLGHPNVVRYLDSGAADGVLWFAMEFVPGTDAATRVRTAGPLTVPAAVRVVVHALKGLVAAHDKGFVHRDVKPNNVLLAQRPDGRFGVKLADFGLARVYAESQLSGLTMTGDVGGTPLFMPPEQILDFRNVGPAGDVYGMAATLYHLITGAYLFDPPFDPVRVMGLVLEADPVPLTTRRAGLPPELVAAVHVGLLKEPAKRWRTAAAFAKALSPFTKVR
jgi:serine/threonine-protein kinase